MFDTQAWYARYYMLGRIHLPCLVDCEAAIKYWMDAEATTVYGKEYVDF